MNNFQNLIILCLFWSCSSNPTPQNLISKTYFPPINSTTWQTNSLENLNWKTTELQPLIDYLSLKNSKAFIILVDGKIVIEHYFDTQSATKNWYWASAGKTLVSTTFGIAEQENYVNINDKVSKYLGTNWTSLSLEQENKITNKHLLTMTSGIDDILNADCITPECLVFNANAGTRWAYHNVFLKLQDVIAIATAQTFENYFNTKLKNKIGMDGFWFTNGNNIVFSSTARSMARFGLLFLNQGKWDEEQILNKNYFDSATQTSQNINQAYGYLWWLNGKSSYHLPQSQTTFLGSLIPTAPEDMYMALGKNDQKIYIIPSKNMVVIRMGDAADNQNLALSDFDKTLWQKINALYQ